MASKLVKILIGVAVAGVVAKIAFGAMMVIGIRSMLDDQALQLPPKKYTPYTAGGVPELPDLPNSEDRTDPLLRSERAMLSLKRKGALGYGTDGWSLRYNTKEDLVALRPDIATCVRIGEHDCYTMAKRHEAEVFYKDDKRVYVHIRHNTAEIFDGIPQDVLKSLRKQYPTNRWRALRPSVADVSYLSTDWTALPDWNGFTMEQLENQGGKGAYFLTATLKGSSTIELQILANAPFEEIEPLLTSMDLGLLHALVSPFPHGGYDTLDDYVDAQLAERAVEDRYNVLSEEALTAKVATLTAQQRVRHMQQVLMHAAKNRNALNDYSITYHPQGDEGLRDTRDFLAGKIDKEDPRHLVLALEQQRIYPIGTCLLTPVGHACRDEAEALRITARLRERAALKAQSDETVYSEQAFYQDMLSIEEQIETVVQRLTNVQAAD